MSGLGWGLFGGLALFLVLAELRRRQMATTRPFDWWERVTRQLVMVHMHGDEGTNRGFLEEVIPASEHGPGGVLLSSVEHLPDDGPPIQLGGRLFISHERIHYIQEPPAPRQQRRAPPSNLVVARHRGGQWPISLDALRNRASRRRRSMPAEYGGENDADELAEGGASKGGKARAQKLTPERRSEIARNAARARWGA